jgi:hypothetical protein
MAKKFENKTVVKTEEPQPTQLVVQELRIMSADRNRKDIGDFKSALVAAESVHYPQRVRLYDLYEDIMLDGHLTGIIGKRIDAVLNKSLFFKDAAGNRVEEMDDVIESMVFRDIVKKILESVMWGISGIEFVPGAEIAFKEIPRKHIKPHKKMIAFEQYGEEGRSYDSVSNIWVIGDEKNLGSLLKCSFYALWKRGNMADWAQYIEIFGQPVRVVYYDAYDTKTKMELRQVLDESGSSLAMMIPKQAQFEMKDGKQSNGNGELQEKFHSILNEEMSIVVLGNTETTRSSKSSGYAQSKEHGKQQLEITKSDLKFVKNLLNEKHFIAILKSYGLPVEGGRFEYEKEIDLEQLKARLEIDREVSTKVPIPDDYWYKTYGIPKPDNYDELKAKMEAKAAALIPPAKEDPAEDDPENTPPPKKKPALKGNLKSRSRWLALRAAVADFFDPAP